MLPKARTGWNFRHFSRPSQTMIDPLEPRRLLTAFFSGTTGDDSIDLRPNSSNGFDFVLNGQVTGSTHDQDIVISGLAGIDLISPSGVFIGTSVELRGGPGNDTYDLGGGHFFDQFAGTFRITELPGEGTDTVSVNSTQSAPPQPPTIKSNKIGTLTFDGNLETKLIDFGNFNDNVVVESVPGGMFLNLGNGTNTVTYGGSSGILEDAPALGRVFGGSGTDSITFDDTGANPNSHHDYTMTSARVENQELFGIENLTLKVREHFNTGFDDNPITMTGIPASLSSITIRDTQGPFGVGADLFIGTESSPIDLDDHALQINVIFDHYYNQEIHDQDANSTGANWLISTVGTTEQRVTKGNFNVSFFSPSNRPIWVYGGSTNDHFGVGGLLDSSFVVVNGGSGDDTLETNNLNGHDNDLDEVFRSNTIFTGFGFGGGPGNDFLDLNDSADQIGDGDQDYFLEDFGANHRLRKGDSTLIMDFGGVERLNLVADADNNSIHSLNTFDFDINYVQHITIDGGAGNDYITNFDPDANAGYLDFERVDHTIIGGPGIDELYVDDADARSDVLEYDVGFNGLTYDSAINDGSLLFDASLETFGLAQNKRGTITRLNSKRVALNLNVTADDGDDTFIVGGGDLDSSGLFVANTTVLGGAGTDLIRFDDRLDAEAFNESETYNFSGFSLSKGGAALTYSAFESQRLDTADVINGQIFVGNTINFNSLSGFIDSTTIEGGSLRDNTVNIGNGNLTNLSGVFNLNLNAAGGVVNIDDQNDTGNDNYILTAAQFVKQTGPSVFPTVNYSGAQFMTINANADGNNIFINGTPAGMMLTVNAGGGSDTMSLGGGNIGANILGAVTLNGGALTDSVTLENNLDTTASTQTLNGLSFVDGGPTHTFSSVDNIFIDNGAGGGTLNMDRVAVFTHADSGSPNQTVNIGGGNLDANLLADCSVGRTTIVNIDDRMDTGNDGYVEDDIGYRKTTAGAHQVGYSTSIGVLNLLANNGNNTIQVNFGRNFMRFFGNGGNDQFMVTDTQPLFSLETIGIDTGSEVVSAVEPMGDYVTVNSDVGTANDVGAKVKLLNNDVIRRLTVNNVGTFQIQTGVTGDVREMNLPGGTIDLAGGALLSRAGGPSLATFRTLLIRGRNNGSWNGTNAAGAINSSLAAGSSIADAVGYGLGSQIAVASIGGFTVNSGDTLLRYTLEGDADLNSSVNISDFSRVASNFNLTGREWAGGDFNYDNSTNIADFSSVAANFNQSAAARPVASLFSEREIEDDSTITGRM